MLLVVLQSRSLASSSDGGRTPDASIFDIGALALPSDQVLSTCNCEDVYTRGTRLSVDIESVMDLHGRHAGVCR